MRSPVLAVVVLAACGGSHDGKPPAKRDAGVEKRPNVEIPFKATSMDMQPNVRPVPIDEPVIPLPKQDSFALLAPGTGTRAPLRYHLATATATFGTTTALTTRHVGADSAWTEPVKLPAIHDGFAISTQPTNLQLRPLPATIDGASPDAEQYTTTWKALLADHRAHVDIDDRGQLGALYFNDDPSGARTGPAKDELAQRLLATIVPLPVEPVGLGAKWRVVTILRQNFAYEKQTATYTLVARDAKTFTIGVDVLRQAEEQRIADPSLPPGATVNLVALLRTMKGSLVIDPARPIGTGELAIEARLHVRVEAKGQSMEQLVEDLGTSTLATTP